VSPEEIDATTVRFTEAIEKGISVLNLEESREIMEKAGIPFNKCSLATTVDEAVSMAKDIEYPLVLKIVSPQIIHKTEVGGVRVGIDNDEELKKAYDEIIASAKKHVPDAEIKGILLEEMVKGTELIIGTTTDPQFGPMIMFGIGGIFVEVYKDVSFRLIPITAGDAKDMLNEIKGKAIFEGVRGLPAADTNQLVEILTNTSNFVNSHPEIKEMDLNPLLVTEKGMVAVDARIILKEKDDIRDKIKAIKNHLEKL
jgi:acyl-CoA synthetase (NDP forming)